MSMQIEYIVYSKDETGKELFEGTFPLESQALAFASGLAEQYGPKEQQDLPVNERIVSISYRHEWRLT